MNIEQKKETVKYKTELFRIYVAIMVADIVGVINFITIDKPTLVTRSLAILGFLLALVFIGLSLDTNSRITKIIKTI